MNGSERKCTELPFFAQKRHAENAFLNAYSKTILAISSACLDRVQIVAVAWSVGQEADSKLIPIGQIKIEKKYTNLFSSIYLRLHSEHPCCNTVHIIALSCTAGPQQ